MAKHRHRWNVVQQRIENGVIVREVCVCECGSLRVEEDPKETPKPINK